MKKFYIKERNNPQIGVYYVPCGQLTKKDAKNMEASFYGYNVMLEFDNKKEYEEKINDLRKRGLLHGQQI